MIRSLSLLVAVALIGCGESIEPGAAVTTITLCTESAEHYSDCFDKDVVSIEIDHTKQTTPPVLFAVDPDPGDCLTRYFQGDEGVVVGDEVELWVRLWYEDGTESETYPVTFEIDDTAATFTVPCP